MTKGTGPASGSLAERLSMDHLTGGLEEAKKAIESSSVAPGADTKDDRDEEVWTFPFDFTDVRGVRWSGSFTNHILSIQEQGYVGVLRSRLQGGQPIDSIDTSVVELNLALAHMSYSLEPKQRPDWARDDKLMNLKMPDVVMALYAQVRSHDDHYFRRRPDQAASESPSS